MSDLVTLRPAEERDVPYLNSYCYSEGMDNVPSLENVTVAVNASDEPVGFIRLAFSDAGIAHVNPVVVHPVWRGYGVGRILVQDALDAHGELRLVSRGSSLAFYQAMGFQNIPWSDIAPGVTDDCDGCELREECQPQPMRKVK
ncbi:MAG: GNAT family N-acetyltransferase [Coriobacteriia bacterium]|nr:GNAT family N-acetyltransferase [Coriobacteriia bacterium]